MIVFLTGDNEYAIKAEIDHHRDNFLKNNDPSGLEEYPASELDISRVADLVSGGSLFSAKRLIIVRDIGDNKELAEAVAEQADQVDDSTILILSQAKPDKRTRWYNSLKKHAKTLSSLRGYELANWVTEEAAKRKGKISQPAAKHLVTLVGEDQWRLSSELDKLLASNELIDEKLIDELVEPASDETIFQLIDMSAKGQVKPALALYERLRLNEIDPYQFVGTLAWQMNALLVVKTNHNRPSRQIASDSGLSPFVIDRLQPLARKLQPSQLKAAMLLVLEADFEMKQTGIDRDQRAKLLIGQLGQLISS